VDGETFYQMFKESLEFLGPGWTGKERITVEIRGQSLVLSCEGKSIVLDLKPKEKEPCKDL